MSVKEGQIKQIEQLQRDLDNERTRRYELEVALLKEKIEWSEYICTCCGIRVTPHKCLADNGF